MICIVDVEEVMFLSLTPIASLSTMGHVSLFSRYVLMLCYQYVHVAVFFMLVVVTRCSRIIIVYMLTVSFCKIPHTLSAFQ